MYVFRASGQYSPLTSMERSTEPVEQLATGTFQ